MAGIAYTKLIEALRGIGVDVSQQSGSNVKTLATKNKSSATKPGLLAGERDTGGNFATVLDIFKKEARYIDGMNDVEQMNFLNNIMDYNEFGGPKILSTSELNQQARDLGLEFKGLRSDKEDITSGIENILKTSKTMKDDAEAGLASAEKDLKDFLDTGGQPLKAKSDKYLGGSMHEEGQLRTAIRTFLKNEFKNGKIKLDKDDQFRIMEYSPMMEDDPIKVFKKIYGDEAYNKAGTFPGAFEIGENFTHYEQIFKENMGEDLLKVKDKKYVGDGTLTLTKQEEVVTPTPDEDMPFAKGGRASFVGGKIVDELVAMIVKKKPMDAMKEVNKIIGKKGKYKNLTQKDIDRIVDQTEDHIFQRDPDNLFVEDRSMFKQKNKSIIPEDEYAQVKKDFDTEILGKNVDDMSVEDSLTTMEGLGATQTAERFRLKQKYPGITDDLVGKILIDDNPQRKAELLATLDEAFRMMEKGKGPDEVVEIFKNTTRTKNAKGGRAGYYGGGQAMVEPDLSDIGHGSDALMARTRLTAPGSQATTSTGLNYLLGEDNDNIRVPFNQGNMVLPKPKPAQSPLIELSRIYKTYEDAMPGVSKDTQKYLQQDFIQKLNDAGISQEAFMTYRMQNSYPEGRADGGRINFQDGLNFDKAFEKMLEKETEEDKNIYEEGEKILTKKLDSYMPNETKKEKEEREMFEMVKEFQTLKKNGILRPDRTFEQFKKMKILKNVKNKILELNVKYPEKKIINDEGMVDKENLKSAIDEAEADLEISPIDGLTLKRSINTEGEQSVTSGSFDIGNLNFSSDNIEEGKLTSKGDFTFGGIDLSGMVDSNDGQILNTELGFNYDNELKGKMTNSDGYRSGELKLDKNFKLPSKFTEASATSDGFDMIAPKIKNKKLKNIIDNLDVGLKGNYDITSSNGQTNISSNLTPKFSYDDGIFNASIAKEILEGGDGLNLGAGVNYNNFYAKGDDLLSKDRNVLVGYQKEFGDKDGDLFFTAGAEKNLFDDENTFGVGLKYKFADGGIAGLRQGYAGGKGVDIARRGFLKLLGGTAAGVVALKTGLVKMFGKESGAISKKAIDEVIIEGGSGAPAWLQPLVNKALREGTDISKQAVKDGQVVKSLDTPTGKVDVYYDTRTGEIDIDYIGGNTALGESVNMRYVPGVADEGTKGVKPADEFEANEAIPQLDSSSGNFSGSHQIAEMGENVTTDVKDLYSDTSELATLGNQKPLIKDISETIKKKKVLKQMNENPDEFAMENAQEYYD